MICALARLISAPSRGAEIFFSLGSVLGAALLIATPPTLAQSALVAASESSSRGFTASNSSGFGFSANGTFLYTGPLNVRRELPMAGSTTLEFDGRTITVSADDALIRSRMPAPRGPANTLSGELSTGVVPATGAPQVVSIGYSVIVPAITSVSGSNGSASFEQVDGQSLSVFPSFSPSVFP